MDAQQQIRLEALDRAITIGIGKHLTDTAIIELAKKFEQFILNSDNKTNPNV